MYTFLLMRLESKKHSIYASLLVAIELNSPRRLECVGISGKSANTISPSLSYDKIPQKGATRPDVVLELCISRAIASVVIAKY